MAFNVSNLTDYTARSTEILQEAVLLGPSITRFEVQSGIKYKEYLNYIDSDPEFQAGGCSLTSSGSTVLDEKEIQVYSIGIKEDFCFKDLDKKAVTADEVEVVLTNDLINKIAKKNDTMLWTGSIAGGDIYNGFKHFIDAGATSLGNATAIDSTNIDDMVLELINAATDAMWARGVLTIFIPLNYFNLYKQNRLAGNYFRDANTKFDLFEMWAFGYEGQVKIVGVPGLAGVDDMYITWEKNLVVGIDEVTDVSSAEWVEDRPNKLMYFMADFKMGTQIKYDNEIIKLR